MTVEELQDRMSHVEFVQWMGFAEYEPLPEQREDFRSAMLMTLLATINKGKKGNKPKLSDFLPDWWQDEKKPAAMARKFRQLTTNKKAEGTTTGAGTTMRGRRRING